jgi:uncharacterized protein YndB with AHSA1/START domain
MGSATTGSATVHIAAPTEKIYALVSDVTRMGEWSPETRSCKWLDGATAPALGVRFRGTNKRKGSWKTTATITAADPGAEFSFAIGKKAPVEPDTTWSYRFVPSGAGTDVTESFEIVNAPGAIGKWFTKLGTGVAWDDRPADMENGMRETLAHLKTAAETAR